MNAPGQSGVERFRPVVAIEVEGLIAVNEELAQLPRSDRWALKLDVWRDQVPEEAADRPLWDDEGHWVHFYWISRTGVDWVKSLVDDHIDVVWYSRWHGAANTLFGEKIGLPTLDSVRDRRRRGPVTAQEFEDSPLRYRSDGRPLLLISRIAPGDGGERLMQARRPRDRAITALRTVPWELGPTPDALADMDLWLGLVSDHAGQEALRNQRRRDLDRARRRSTPAGEIHYRLPQAGSVKRIIARDRAIYAWVEKVVDEVRKILYDRGFELSDLGTPRQAADLIVEAMKEAYLRDHDRAEDAR